MNPQHEQPRRQDPPKTPVWVREPEKPKVEFKHSPADEHQVEEPGYGHGV
jgi:hypothetical protein